MEILTPPNQKILNSFTNPIPGPAFVIGKCERTATTKSPLHQSRILKGDTQIPVVGLTPLARDG